MANTALRQDDLWRVAIDGETTVGTYESPDSSSVLVPAIGFTGDMGVRGTGLIARADVATGDIGGVSGVVGSQGWTFALEQECQLIAGSAWAPWILCLAACGHAVDFNNVSGTLTLTPSLLPVTAYAGGTTDANPISLSLTAIRNTGGVADECQRVRGVTGTATLRFAANERLVLATQMVGLVVSDVLIDQSDTNMSDIGAWVGTGVPLVCTGWTVAFTDEDGSSNPLDLAGLSSIEIVQGATTPDVPVPGGQGLSVAPVLMPESPTVTFTIGDTNTNSSRAWSKFKSGGRLKLVSTFTSGNTSVTVTVPSIEFADLKRVSQDGYNALQVSGRIVRANLGTTAPLYSIAVDFTA